MNLFKKDTYTSTIPKEAVMEPSLEYYIQALDKAGNVSLHGFSSEPLEFLVLKTLPLTGEETEKSFLM